MSAGPGAKPGVPSNGLKDESTPDLNTPVSNPGPSGLVPLAKPRTKHTTLMDKLNIHATCAH